MASRTEGLTLPLRLLLGRLLQLTLAACWDSAKNSVSLPVFFFGELLVGALWFLGELSP